MKPESKMILLIQTMIDRLPKEFELLDIKWTENHGDSELIVDTNEGTLKIIVEEF